MQCVDDMSLAIEQCHWGGSQRGSEAILLESTSGGKKWAIQKSGVRRFEGGREAIHDKNRTVTADRERGHR